MAGAAGYVLKQITRHRPRRRGPAGRRRASRCSTRPSPRGSWNGCGPAHLSPTTLKRLTDQERRILALIAEGLTNRQIGEQMFLAEKTVKNYVSSLLSKLGMERRTQAAVFAVRILRP